MLEALLDGANDRASSRMRSSTCTCAGEVRGLPLFHARAVKLSSLLQVGGLVCDGATVDGAYRERRGSQGPRVV